jgi:hypothetical protein
MFQRGALKRHEGGITSRPHHREELIGDPVGSQSEVAV